MYFSKSKYCQFCQCSKMSWLAKNKPEEAAADGSLQSRLDTGNDVGDLAMGYFGDFAEVTAYKEDGRLDLAKMIEDTKAEMEKNTPVICEASFDFGGLYCAVDILRREGDGWSIYEVKSSGEVKPIYVQDVAYQKYVLEHCGVKVVGTWVMCLNKTYFRGETLDIHQLFRVNDVSGEVAEKLSRVEENLKNAEKILACDREPEVRLGQHCSKPYDCAYWNYCTRDIPKPNVFDLYYMSIKRGSELYYRGVCTFEDIEKEGLYKDGIKGMQIDHYLHPQKTHVDKENLGKFLERLTYPIYFLDFETFQTPVPLYPGTKPFDQIPFQYSLHYIESEGGELQHSEFLAEAGSDPLRPIAEALCRDIPMNGTMVAYNVQFECGTLRLLARLFPDLMEHLMSIHRNAHDLLEPFREGWYYDNRMSKGFDNLFSIKNVLPSMFPDDPSLDYHSLDGIHNGGEAMAAFPRMAGMTPEEREETRKNLLKYCGLDTLALVKIWGALREAAGLG